jgi:hypothetical protein
MSMRADRASSQIINALRENRSEHILTLPAQIAARLHGASGVDGSAIDGGESVDSAGAEGGSTHAAPGHETDEQMSRVFKTLTSLGRVAAQRLNQQPV